MGQRDRRGERIDERGRKVVDGYSIEEDDWDAYGKETPKYYRNRDKVVPTHDIQDIVKMTAKLSGKPEELVNFAIKETFTSLKSWLRKPYGSGSVLINDYGRFTINLWAINKRIERLVPFLRGKNRDRYLPKFKDLWERRQLAIKYENRRKSTKRKLTFEKKKN